MNEKQEHAAPAAPQPEMTTEEIDGLWEKETGFALDSHATIEEADILGFARGIASRLGRAGGEDARDAARYRKVRRGQQWSVIDGIGNTLRAEELDSAIDAAIASEQKEGEA